MWKKGSYARICMNVTPLQASLQTGCFDEVLKSTRAQLEEELLMDDVLRIEDMPSFHLLH
ncbi:ELMO domain-containing protein [Artemisia annua]|uniref:ELMO domain-containing protein n=1 Tax=Artemisia annua TaxID=35608 RepID=A0A2U1KF13_ARTAN|nr:ELMO domain-containing protein [Artemisia annua]